MTSRRFVLVAALAALVASTPAHALRLVNYNILNYPGSTGSARAVHFRTILAPLAADIIVAEEITSTAAPTQFLNEVLEVMEPGQWGTMPLLDGNDTDSAIFYRKSAIDTLGHWAFYPNPANLLRYVHVFRLRPTGYVSGAAEIRIYSCHLKASTGFESQRLAECVGLRDSMNAMPAGTHGLIAGDLNFYTQSAEAGYAKLLETQANNIGRVYDLLPAGSWHDNASFANIHTQSPCLSGGGACASGASTGGMDDRFDFILPTDNWSTGQGLSVIPGTLIPVGNDGLHLNKNITDAPTIPEGTAYASALQLASDHLPLRIDIQLPAKISTPSLVTFGTVIAGAPAAMQSLGITNTATGLADSLNCAFTAPSGFTAPGALAIAAGATGNASLGMLTSSAGAKAGTLAIASDAPDAPVANVSLSGTVLEHAVASLDSTAVVLAGAVDFGVHEAGQFTQQTVRVYNTGYDALHARLLVTGIAIAGGDGRFSLVSGPVGGLLSSTGADVTVAFDDAGATLDSTYTGSLAVSSADEPLPGALAQPDLTVALQAHVMSGAVRVDDAIVPTTTRLFAASPNPFRGVTSLRLDLAQATRASVAVFDLAGRQVATLRDGTLAAGRQTVSWDGRDASGAAVGSGVYVIRFAAAGLAPQNVRVAFVR